VTSEGTRTTKHVHPAREAHGRATRALILFNPAAGSGEARQRVETARPILEAEGLELEVMPTSHGSPSPTMVAALESAELVIVAGGDGTLNGVIQDLHACSRDALPPLGILPAGTGDALARDLGIAGTLEGARAVTAGTRRSVDLARVQVDGAVRYAFSVVGWGAFARINWRAERWRIFGGRRYDVAALVELLAPRLQNTRAVRDGHPDPTLMLGAACLTRYTARGMLLAPKARLDDGMVEVVEIRRAPRRTLLSLLGRISQGHPPDSPLVSTARVPGLELALEPGSRVVLDGESLPAREVRVEVSPGALEIFAPPAAETTKA